MNICKHYFPHLVQHKICFQKAFNFAYWQFFDITNFFEPNKHPFHQFELLLEVKRPNRQFSDNPGHNILEIYGMLVQVQFAKSKTKLDIQYNKLGIRVAE